MKTLLVALMAAALSGPAHAATQADAEAALAGATRVEAGAAPGNRWVPTDTALKAAKAAIASKNWDLALDEATKARSLASLSVEQSVEQSKQQDTAWHDAVIR